MMHDDDDNFNGKKLKKIREITTTIHVMYARKSVFCFNDDK